MNWRRIFAVMAVRVGMIAVVLFALMLIRADALKEKEPKPAIKTASIGVRCVEPYPYLCKINHIHRLYFFPNEEKEAKEFGNVIVLKKKMYIDGYLREEYEYDGRGNCTSDIRYNGDCTVSSKRVYENDDMGNKTKGIRHPGNSNDIRYRYDYKYDKEGREIRYTYYDYDGIIKECYESVYDEMGNLIKRSELKKGTGYHFNIFGELFVFKTMKEESVTKYEYEYS